MELSAVKTWQWMLIALVVGLLVGAAQSHYRQPIHGNYVEGFGYFLGDQNRFENALTTEIEGQRRFHDITVYIRQVDDAAEPTTVYLVKGTYYSGLPQTAQGRTLGGWQPTVFIAPVPYEPLIDFSTLEKPGSPDWGKTFRTAGLRPTVLDFLSVMHSAAGVRYRYAWWDAYPITSCVLASVAIIGCLWPILVNVLSFRRITRPPQAAALSLWKVRNRKTLKSNTSVCLDSTLSDHSVVQTTDNPRPPEPAIDEAIGAKALPANEQEHAASASNQQPREFAARDEDFYPTERRTPPGH